VGVARIEKDDKKSKKKRAQGKAQLGATYSIGKVYLDSIDGKATALSDGNYELLLQFNKTISAG